MQDNGAGAPLHFATTHRNIDMVSKPVVMQRSVSEIFFDHVHRSARGLHPPLPATAPQMHHLVSLGAHVNQRDAQGLTPLHRAACLAHLDGYQECYEYLLAAGADPAIRSEDYDPYLTPGPKLPLEVSLLSAMLLLLWVDVLRAASG